MDFESKKKLKALIVSSVRDFNLYREENPDQEIELANMVFNDMDLSGINFSGVILGLSQFIGAKLEGADFSGAQLRGVRFLGAKLKDSRFDDAFCGKTDFTGSDLRNASLKRLKDLDDTRFFKCDLRGANFEGTSITGHMTRESRFDSAGFTETMEGWDLVKSRAMFIFPIIGALLLLIFLLAGGWFLYLKANEKELGKAEFVSQARISYYQGYWEIKRGNFESAEIMMRNAVKLDPKQPQYLMGLGDVLVYRQQYKKAVKTYQQGMAMAKDPALKSKFDEKIRNMKRQ